MKIVRCTRESARGTPLIYIISHQERFHWKNAKYQIAGMALYLEDMVLLVQERDKERCNDKQNFLYCNMLSVSQARKDRGRLSKDKCKIEKWGDKTILCPS